MQQEHGGVHGLLWQVCDVRQLSDLHDPDEPFAGIVEKGCLDAMLCGGEESAAQYVDGLARLLPAGGPLLVVSNSLVRHRHLSAEFVIHEVQALQPEEGPFGPALYICERRP
mmetsp:Transcript_61386/g.138315  ORF Transcript_61386/g.138315 Transcript_61386/m.138315 type:complete len:112 (-) Transcript_61386:8-343(-)